MTGKTNNSNTNTNTGANDMNSNITLDAVLDMLADKVAERLSGGVVADKPALPAKKAATKAKAEPEPEEEADPMDARRAELEAMTLAALKKVAKAAGFDPEDIKGADKGTLVESIIDDEFNSEDDDEDEPDDEPDEDDEADDEAEDDEDEAEDEDEDEDDDEGESYTREELEEMSLKDLKGLAKEAGYTAADIKGLDQDSIVDLLAGDDDEDDEDDDDTYTEDDLKAMDLKELLALAKEYDIEVPTADRRSKKKVIDALMA